MDRVSPPDRRPRRWSATWSLLFALSLGSAWLWGEAIWAALRSERVTVAEIMRSPAPFTYLVFFGLVVAATLFVVSCALFVRRRLQGGDAPPDDPARLAFAIYLPVLVLGIPAAMINLFYLPHIDSPPSIAFNLGVAVATLAGFYLLSRKALPPERWIRFRRRLSVPRLAVVLAGLSGLGLLVVGLAGERDREVRAAGGRAVESGRPNVVFILIDTLRADHLGVYGYERDTSPTIDRLAERGTRFEHFIAQSSWTRPTVASIFTGLYPSQHRAVTLYDQIPDSIVTLPEAMRRLGYRTGGFSANINVSETFGFHRGFERFYAVGRSQDIETALGQLRSRTKLLAKLYRFRLALGFDPVVKRDDEEITERALRWLDDIGDDRFFLYLHYIAPHSPYAPPPPFRDLFKRDPTKNHPNNYRRALVPKYGEPQPELSEEDLETLVALYDGEIAYVDSIIQSVVEELERSGQWDETLLIITSDHGEEFYDHENWGHGLTLYEEQIRVPLIVRQPGDAFAGRVITTPLSQVDLYPTLMRALDGPEMPAEAPGIVFPLDAGAAGVSSAREIYVELIRESYTLRALRASASKFIRAEVLPEGRSEGEPTIEKRLYSLSEDPGEQYPTDTGGEILEVLDARLDGYASAEGRHDGQSTELDAEAIEQLRALGYID